MVQLSLFVSAATLLASLATITEARVLGGSNHHQLNQFQKRGADVSPSAPGPGSVFRAGGQCPIEWSVGTASRWKSMTIDLMTGANKDMVKITNVASDIDGTTKSSYSWTCPEVDPNAPVYFYQFTDKNGANPAWTTRFTIASDSGAVVAAPNPTQPDGSAIPWGVGKLANGSSSSSSSSSNGSSSGSSDDTNSSSNGTSSSSSSSNSNDSSNQSSSSSSSAPSETQSSTNGSSSSSNRSTTSGSSSVHGQIGTTILSTFAIVMGALLI